jgi:hypothetical protein
MKTLHKKRLLKLAKHLRSGKLGHKRFNFNTFNEGEKNEQGCGTTGCAIGECPIVFPKQWHFDAAKDPVVRGELSCSDSGEVFFGISYMEFAHLFFPQGQDVEKYGGKFLEQNATPKQVAANIEAFVKRKERK